jgi:hypothetical protein
LYLHIYIYIFFFSLSHVSPFFHSVYPLASNLNLLFFKIRLNVTESFPNILTLWVYISHCTYFNDGPYYIILYSFQFYKTAHLSSLFLSLCH